MSQAPAPAEGPWLLDTSVVVDLADPAVLAALPETTVISVVTLAELAAGPLVTDDDAERARRQRHLQEVEALYDPLPVDAPAARAFGEIVSAFGRLGRRNAATAGTRFRAGRRAPTTSAPLQPMVTTIRAVSTQNHSTR